MLNHVTARRLALRSLPPRTANRGGATARATGPGLLVLGALGVCVASTLVCGAAQAQQAVPYASANGPRVAIMRFDGREAANPPTRPLQPEAAASCVHQYFQELGQRDPRALRYEVLAPERWAETARRHGRGQVQRIAEELKADLVIGGWLEQAREGRAPYKMTLALYSNWADPLGLVTVDLWSKECDTRMLGRGTASFLAQINQALGLGVTSAAAPARPRTPPPAEPPREPVATKEPPPPREKPRQTDEPVRKTDEPRRDEGPVRQAEDREAAPIADGSLVPAAKGAASYLLRQPWRETFSLQAGYLFSWRRFTDANDTGFNVAGTTTGLPGAHGLALQGEIYPLAASSRVPLAAAGLGMRVAVLLPFWPGVVQKDTAGNRLGSYSTSELRIDWGFLRWHWNISEALLRPELVLEALYGYHRFDFARQDNSAIVLPLPSAGYQYLGGSVGMRMHFPYRIAAQVGLTVAGILDMGPMGLPGSDPSKPPGQDLGFLVYGPGGGVLFRLDAGFFIPLYKGLGVSAAGFYERTALSFDGLGDVLDKNKMAVRSATDEYAGLMAGLRYWY